MSGRSVSSPGRRLRVLILCTGPGPSRVFSGVDGHGSPLYRQPLARLFSLVNFSLSLGNEQPQSFYPYMDRSAQCPVFTVLSHNSGQCEGARSISLNNFVPPLSVKAGLQAVC